MRKLTVYILIAMPVIFSVFPSTIYAAQTIPYQLGEATLKMAEVLSDIVIGGQQCAYGTTKLEILQMLERAYRSKGNAFPRAKPTPEQIAFIELVKNNGHIQGALGSYLGFRLFVHQIDLNQFSPPLNLELVRNLLVGTTFYSTLGKMPFTSVTFTSAESVVMILYNSETGKMENQVGHWKIENINSGSSPMAIPTLLIEANGHKVSLSLVSKAANVELINLGRAADSKGVTDFMQGEPAVCAL